MYRVMQKSLSLPKSTWGQRRTHGLVSKSRRRTVLSASYASASSGTFPSGNNKKKSQSHSIVNHVHHQQHHHHIRHHDRLLVIGSGVAGSATALIAAATYNIPVTMIYAGRVPTDCNSYWAQGGIIYRNYDPASGDSAESLAQDIHRAGAGLCDDAAVQKVAQQGPDRVRQLLLSDSATSAFANVPFDRVQKEDGLGILSLCLEASHAAPRILHKADHTGKTITEHITAAATRHPLITQQPHTIVTDLIVEDGVCIGVQTLDRASGQLAVEYASRGTVLASGGLAGIYEHSTNPPGFNALGSSVALAVRAQAQVQDLEYVQFHPTSLFIPNEARFLLTEALRGEGAVLRDATGRAFAKEYHPAGELAPRDVVARAVFEESQKVASSNNNNNNIHHHEHNVFLDITHRDRDWLHQRFPSIQQHLAQRNLDLARDLLPIIPAAHYTCGGIKTDMSGRTNIPGLYAAGEAARTGLHGGNRLASTSLLEGLVFGASVADFVGAQDEAFAIHDHAMTILERPTTTATSAIASQYHTHPYDPTQLEPSHIENSAHRAFELLRQLRRIMWDNVGVVRTPSGLATAVDQLHDIVQEISYMHEICPTLETTAVRDAATAGLAVAQAAHANRIPAGAHYIIAEEEEEDDNNNAVESARMNAAAAAAVVAEMENEEEEQVVAAAR